MVILAYSLVEHCFEVAFVVIGTIGEGKVEEDTIYEVIIDKGVGYEKNDSLDGSSSIQESRKLDGLVVVVSMVTKS